LHVSFSGPRHAAVAAGTPFDAASFIAITNVL
jgi:hypothetical protein